jgi:superfamily II RNA helicase
MLSQRKIICLIILLLKYGKKQFKYIIQIIIMDYLLKEKENIFISSYIEANNQHYIHQILQEHQLEPLETTHLKKKIIYILPLKSLCNQIYHYYYEFYKKVFTIGIITGERRCNTDANLIIMTPEILLQLMYKNEINKEDVDLVIFDKFQYINDDERGKNIEELLKNILPFIQCVFFSLPFSNLNVLLSYLEKISIYPFHYIENKEMEKQTHYLYYDLHPGYYNSLPISNAQNILQRIKKCIPLTEEVISKVYYDITTFKSLNGYVKKDYLINNVILECKEKDMFPAVCLILSRRNLEKIVESLHISLLNEIEKDQIEEVCLNILKVLPNYTDYTNLVEYKILLKLFKRGLGIHHAGMIPIFKELVEIMFQGNYIKLVFSTETFFTSTFQSIKTIILTENVKFDGSEERVLNSAEYISYFQRIHDYEGNIVHLPNFYSSLDLDFFQMDTFEKEICFSSKFYETIPFTLQNRTRDNYLNKMLLAKEFIDEENNLTTKGMIASEITEVFPLFIAELFDDIIDLSGKKLVSLLSCFLYINTNIYVPFHFSSKMEEDSISIIAKVMTLMDEYEVYDIQDKYYFYYYLFEYVELWYEAKDDVEYKKVLNKIKRDKIIFVGDFVKALLKIMSIVNELKGLARKFDKDFDSTYLDIQTGLLKNMLKYVKNN